MQCILSLTFKGFSEYWFVRLREVSRKVNILKSITIYKQVKLYNKELIFLRIPFQIIELFAQLKTVFINLLYKFYIVLQGLFFYITITRCHS